MELFPSLSTPPSQINLGVYQNPEKTGKAFLGVLYGQFIKDMKSMDFSGEETDSSQKMFWDLLCEHVGNKMAESSLGAPDAKEITEKYMKQQGGGK